MSADTVTASGRIVAADGMESFAASLARGLPPASIIHLIGPLAAGKTTFARGYIQALGHTGAVKSPTYTLVESYQLSARSVHHFDLYRLVDGAELEFIGIDDYFDGSNDVLVEWPERGGDYLPSPDLKIVLTVTGDAREFTATALTEACSEVIRKLNNLY